ncbi:hypothetical protein E4T80_08600 [Muribacter muris]|uniref:Uncharacterized protein n=1 Tax=Muribacter muris TaxID=67855 RepID=A0A4Y9JTY0_9PAST|nr:Imm15 family immunity protein [Muribacter muris]MBF0785517.1 hypothetical protein [Muribacter muris]MBF0826553.1 hypothetical protein [Muribacter muris]TFV09244.1 hypothetical protein E4T80_08600 [Muribacter muris]
MFYRNILSILDNNKFIMFDNIINYKGAFEEPSLVLRHDQVNSLNMSVKDINATLFNLALFHLRNIKLIAKNKLSEKEFNDLFICLTITDDISEDYFITPNFYVSNIKNMTFLQKLEQCKNKIINNIFIELDVFKSISILESTWFDNNCNRKLSRYYIVSDEMIRKIRPNFLE